MQLEAVIARIEDSVPELTGRVEGLAQLSLLLGNNEVPQVTPAAFVIPLGLDAGEQIDATSVHEQLVTESIGVVIVIDYAGDHHGASALPGAETLVNQVINAVTGWQSDPQSLNFSLRRGRLLSANNGTMFYQLDFSIQYLLRI